MKTVAIIPARKWSARVPGKNWREFHGKPIIQYSIETAQHSRLFDEIWVSTDGEEIAQAAKSAGAQVFERRFDDGVRGTQEVAAEVLRDARMFKASIACVIYATAPMMTTRDLIEGWQLLQRAGATWARAGDINCVDIGYFYWGHVEAFLVGRPLNGPDTEVHIIPPHRAIDINTEDDFLRAERMYAGESI
jgi:N-acylneuraminate cytidylyltransferase